MKAQQKTLPDGSGAGKGWILAQQLRKPNWVMDQQDTWKHHQKQKQWCGRRLGAMRSKTDKIDKQNLELTYINLLYNRFALLATDEDDDDYEKTTIINNQTPKTIDTAYSTSLMKITKNESIADEGATGNFFLPVTRVKDLQPAIIPISINITEK